MWHYQGDDFVLRAREDIAVGDEITVSYLSEEALLEATACRRQHLEKSKHFMCHCDRCMTPLDCARGFVCLRCKEGELHLDVGGPTKPITVDGACGQCGFLANASQAAELCDQEARVDARMREWDRKATRASADVYLTDAAVLRIETNLAGLLSAGHWLRDRANRHLVSYYESTQRADLALPLAKKCVDFAKETYPGRSAAQAWALETQGDLLLRLEGFELDTSASVVAPSGCSLDVLSRARSEVCPTYEEATEILGLLFGKEHEFTVVMREKLSALRHATRKASRSAPEPGRKDKPSSTSRDKDKMRRHTVVC